MRLAQGQKVRITETFEAGTVVTYVGILEQATDTEEYGATATFLGGACAWARDRETGSDGTVRVLIEPVAPPLPDALGSVIKYYYAGLDRPEQYQVQMRVMEAESPHMPGVKLGWICADGSRVADPLPTGYWEVIHDAAAH